MKEKTLSKKEMRKKNQKKTRQAESAALPPIVVTTHSDYPLFPMKAAAIGRYLLIFFGALGVNLTFADAMKCQWNSSFVIAPIVLYLVLMAAWLHLPKSRIPLGIFGAAVLGFWFFAGGDTPVDFFVGGFAGFWNSLMDALRAEGYVVLPNILKTYEYSNDSLYATLSLISVLYLAIFTTKKVRFLFCAAYLGGMASIPFFFGLKMQNASIALVLSVLLALFVMGVSQLRSFSRTGAWYLGFASFVLAWVLLFFPVFRFERPMVNLVFIQNSLTKIEAVLDQLTQKETPQNGGKGTGTLLQSRPITEDSFAGGETEVMDVFTQSQDAQYLRSWIGSDFVGNMWEIPGKEEARRGYSLYSATVQNNTKIFVSAVLSMDSVDLNAIGYKESSVHVVPLTGGELMAIPVTALSEVSRPTQFQILSDGIWVQEESDRSPYTVQVLLGRDRGGNPAYVFCRVLEGYRKYLLYEKNYQLPQNPDPYLDALLQMAMHGKPLGNSAAVEKNTADAKKIYSSLAEENLLVLDTVVTEIFLKTDILEYFTVSDVLPQDREGQRALFLSEPALGGGKYYLAKTDIASVDAIARIVSDYLRDHYRYNLSPQKTEEADKLAAFLLESREGYCMHFATAGTLLLRRMGLTTRYAEGYVAKDFGYTDSSDPLHKTYPYVCRIRDDDAHAWTEVWLEGFGWQIYEMTPGYETLNRFNTPLYSVSNPTDPPDVPETTEPDEEPEEPITPIVGQDDLPWGVILGVSFSALVLLTLIFLALRLISGQRRHRRRRKQLLTRAASPVGLSSEEKTELARELMLALEPALELFGLAMQAGEMPSAYALRVQEGLTLPDTELSAGDAVEAMMEWVYRCRVQEESLILVSRLLVALGKKAKKEFSFRKRLEVFFVSKIF